MDIFFFFFFQAEDGIRDLTVTGVQTCALPILILVRRETSPEDVGGMFVAQGILTATGGKTSHAAVVARGWGKCCIVGCERLDVDYGAKVAHANGKSIHQGDWMTLDGNEGIV